MRLEVCLHVKGEIRLNRMNVSCEFFIVIDIEHIIESLLSAITTTIYYICYQNNQKDPTTKVHFERFYGPQKCLKTQHFDSNFEKFSGGEPPDPASPWGVFHTPQTPL